MQKIFFYEKNPLIFYRTLCSMLTQYGSWSRMACNLGNDNGPSVSVKVTKILDQNVGSGVLKDAAP